MTSLTLTSSEGAIERLQALVSQLENDPPIDQPALERIYFTEIRETIKQIETEQRPSNVDSLLDRFDTDFNEARVLYSLLKPGFHKVKATSVAQHYHFFIGGLKLYLSMF